MGIVNSAHSTPPPIHRNIKKIVTTMFSWIAVVFSVLLASLWCIDSLLMRRKNRKNGGLPPGPKGLPVLGNLHMLSDLPHYDLHKLAQKYGPIMHMRLGVVPAIVISSPEAAELFLKTHDLVFASRPKLQAAHNLNYWEKDVAFAQYGSHWRNMRKVCTLQLLSATKIESMKSMRTEDIEGFVKALKYAAEAHEVVDLSEKVGCLIENNTYGMIFGRKYEMLDFKESANEMLRLVGAFNLADYVPLAGLFDLQGIRRSMKGASKVIDVLLENIISDHVQHAANKTQQESANHHKNFIDIMLSLTEFDSEYQLDRGSMKAIILDMIIGGIDTSSVTIDWTLCELFKHPNIMKKVQSELENVVGMDRMIEESDLVKLEYLDLVVKESMRLHPVVPIITPRESREDIVINGYQIPKQSRILVNAWAIGRDPNAWFSNVDVNEFYPERFLGTNVDYRGNDFRFLPFGSGRRGCPGLQLGILMVQLVLAHLLHCFNWELPDGISPNDLDMKEKPGLTTPRAKPLLAIPTFRLNI